MTQSISEYFRAALVLLLDKEGRGAQSRLARQQGVDRGYLNAIVKGRKAGADHIRAKIAGHFDMTYEEMITLGRKAFEQKGVMKSGSSLEPKNHLPSPMIIERVLEGKVDIDETLISKENKSKLSPMDMKIAEIINSETAYSRILKDLIDVIHEGVSMKRDHLVFDRRISLLEKQLSTLEKKLLNN